MFHWSGIAWTNGRLERALHIDRQSRLGDPARRREPARSPQANPTMSTERRCVPRWRLVRLRRAAPAPCCAARISRSAVRSPLRAKLETRRPRPTRESRPDRLARVVPFDDLETFVVQVCATDALSVAAGPGRRVLPRPGLRQARRARSPCHDERFGESARTTGGSPVALARRRVVGPDLAQVQRSRGTTSLERGRDIQLTPVRVGGVAFGTRGGR
jgi:hypothetical protein